MSTNLFYHNFFCSCTWFVMKEKVWKQIWVEYECRKLWYYFDRILSINTMTKSVLLLTGSHIQTVNGIKSWGFSARISG